jgi:MFS family permease
MISQSRIHIINFCRKLAVNAVFFLVPLHFLKLGFEGWEIGAVTSLYAFAPLVFSFPTGWANDRLSIREIIHAALALFSLMLLVLSQVRDFIPAAAVFLFLGLANNALDVSINNLYYKDSTAVDQNKKYSRLVFWQSLGSAAGPILGGLIVTSAGFPVLFIVFAVFLLAAQAFVPSLNRIRFSRVPRQIYRGNLLRPKTLLFSVMIFIIGLHWGLEGTVYSPFLKQYFNLSTLSLSLYISLSLLALAISQLLIGTIPFDLKVNKRIFRLSLVLSGGGLILMVNRSLALSFIFRLVHEAGDGLLGALVVLFISRQFERESIGGSSAILQTVMTCGHMVGALVFSSLGFRFGLVYPFLIAGGLLIADSAFSTYCFRRVEY